MREPNGGAGRRSWGGGDAPTRFGDELLERALYTGLGLGIEHQPASFRQRALSQTYVRPGCEPKHRDSVQEPTVTEWRFTQRDQAARMPAPMSLSGGFHLPAFLWLGKVSAHEGSRPTE